MLHKGLNLIEPRMPEIGMDSLGSNSYRKLAIKTQFFKKIFKFSKTAPSAPFRALCARKSENPAIAPPPRAEILQSTPPPSGGPRPHYIQCLDAKKGSDGVSCIPARNAYLRPHQSHCVHKEYLPPSPPNEKLFEIHIFVLKYVLNDCKSISKKNSG